MSKIRELNLNLKNNNIENLILFSAGFVNLKQITIISLRFSRNNIGNDGINFVFNGI